MLSKAIHYKDHIGYGGAAACACGVQWRPSHSSPNLCELGWGGCDWGAECIRRRAPKRRSTFAILSVGKSLKAGRWFLSVRFQGEAPSTGAEAKLEAVGDDLGFASFLSWADGEELKSIDPPGSLR